jgi:hypothetical protein
MNKHSNSPAEHHGPPTAEEMLAWSNGELPADEAARVWERLQQYPELARAYTDPFPETGAEPGEPDHVSEAELDRRWTMFRKRVQGDRGRVVQFPRILSTIAAGIIVVLGGLLWQSQMNVRQLQNELAAPRVLEQVVLDEDAPSRGGTSATRVVTGKDLKLVLLLTNADHFDQYKAELRAAGESRPRWERNVERSDEDDVEITLLRIEPGQYQIVLYGITGGKTQRLGAYSFNVAP